jgi:hypothetical protein
MRCGWRASGPRMKLNFVVERVEVGARLIGLAQAETFLRSLERPGVLPEKPCAPLGAIRLPTPARHCNYSS